MGQSNSHYNITTKCNALCPICMYRPNAIPNMAGRFFLINDNECQCNGCNSIFSKSLFYKSGITVVSAKPYDEEQDRFLSVPIAQIMDRDIEENLEITPLVRAYLLEHGNNKN